MRAGVGHIGSALSIADIVAALYADILDTTNPRDGDRDRLVLSKGHASLALYAALHLRNTLTFDELSTYCEDGTRLGTHPEPGVPGVDFATGSLGHGLSLAAGAALAGRLQATKTRAFCLLSDAECNEGSVWEAVMFAAHHRLSNLVAVIDLNGQQALGYTKGRARPIADGRSLACIRMGRARGGRARPGRPLRHDPRPPHRNGPTARARRAHGVRQGRLLHGEQHRVAYLPMTEAQFERAMKEVVAA